MAQEHGNRGISNATDLSLQMGPGSLSEQGRFSAHQLTFEYRIRTEATAGPWRSKTSPLTSPTITGLTASWVAQWPLRYKGWNDSALPFGSHWSKNDSGYPNSSGRSDEAGDGTAASRSSKLRRVRLSQGITKPSSTGHSNAQRCRRDLDHSGLELYW